MAEVNQRQADKALISQAMAKLCIRSHAQLEDVAGIKEHHQQGAMRGSASECRVTREAVSPGGRALGARCTGEAVRIQGNGMAEERS